MGNRHRESQHVETLATNHPAPGKAGIAPRFAIEHHWLGLPEPKR
jgi:hypothetical protein